MPLQLKPRDTSPLPPFTFSPPSSPIEPVVHPPRPPADFIPERDMHMFGAQPLVGSGEAGRGLIKCTRCGKVTMEWAVAEHKRICAHVLDGTPLTVKKGLKADKGLKSDGNKKRRASEVSSSSASPTKKRAKLPDTVAEAKATLPLSYKGMKKSEIKRLEKERLRAEKKEAKEREKLEIAERKRQRASCPIDYDRQCGVINDKGLPCSRSLTCKTHNVGAKRSVEGRTRPYDILYLEWQRANNPNFKEPPTKKDKEARKAEKREREKAANVLKKKKSTNLSGWDEDGQLDGEEGRRELDELIHMARMAGDRLGVKGGPTGKLGAWFGVSGIGMGAAGNNVRISGSWRAGGNYEFSQVGDMLTKALAARTKPQQQPQSAVNMNATGLNTGGGHPGPGSVPMPKMIPSQQQNQHVQYNQQSSQSNQRMIPLSMATGGPTEASMQPNQYSMVAV